MLWLFREECYCETRLAAQGNTFCSVPARVRSERTRQPFFPSDSTSLSDLLSTVCVGCCLASTPLPLPQTKGTASFGKRHSKTHTICPRCGRTSFHKNKMICSSCGYPGPKMRRCEYSCSLGRYMSHHPRLDPRVGACKNPGANVARYRITRRGQPWSVALDSR